MVEEETATKNKTKKSTWGTKREEKRRKEKQRERKRDSIQNIEICNVDTRESRRETCMSLHRVCTGGTRGGVRAGLAYVHLCVCT